MTTVLPAICKGDTLKLLKPLGLPDDTSVLVTVVARSDAKSGAWDDEQVKAFEATAYGSDEPDYGTLDSLE